LDCEGLGANFGDIAVACAATTEEAAHIGKDKATSREGENSQ